VERGSLEFWLYTCHHLAEAGARRGSHDDARRGGMALASGAYLGRGVQGRPGRALSRPDLPGHESLCVVRMTS
jgi:hypothetical protein